MHWSGRQQTLASLIDVCGEIVRIRSRWLLLLNFVEIYSIHARICVTTIAWHSLRPELCLGAYLSNTMDNKRWLVDSFESRLLVWLFWRVLLHSWAELEPLGAYLEIWLENTKGDTWSLTLLFRSLSLQLHHEVSRKKKERNNEVAITLPHR